MVVQFSSVQFLSHIWLFVTSWIAVHQASLSITNSWSSLRLTSIESMMPSNYIISVAPFSSCPQSFPAPGSFFSTESALPTKWPKYWSFSFSINHSIENSGLTSLRIEWFDLLAVQGTLKSLLQHHSSKTSILQFSPFFVVQLLHPYMTTGKTITLTRWTFVGKVMSLLFAMLFGLIIDFLPRSKHLLILRMQSPSAMILEPKKIKSVTLSIISPSICHKGMGPDAMLLFFWLFTVEF